jgi:hypothetical protein
VEIRKFDNELQIAYAEVYAPNVPDSDGDFMTPVELRKTAHKFLMSKSTDHIDVNHDHNRSGAMVVESFIARKDDPDFIPESWVVGVFIPDPDLWQRVKSQELNGFSIEASVKSNKRKVNIPVPEFLTGETSEVEGHSHRFKVEFDIKTGGFVGGRTLDDDTGHGHSIVRGTVTEKTEDHRHRFSFAELLLPLEIVP